MKDFIPPFFNDFGKTVADILKPSKYDFDRTVEIKTKSESGASFGVNGTLADAGTKGSISYKNPSAVPYFDMNNEFNLNGTMKSTFTSTSLAKGLKVVGSLATTNPGKEAVNLVAKKEFSYVMNNVAATASFQTDLNKNIKGDASLALGIDGFSVGGVVAFKDSAISDYNVGAEYAGSDYFLTLKSSNMVEALTLSYSHVVTPNVTAVSSFGYDFGSPSPSKKLSFGGRMKLDSSSSLMCMLTTQGDSVVESVAYETALNANTKLSFSAATDLTNLSYGKHKFGVKLSFNY